MRTRGVAVTTTIDLTPPKKVAENAAKGLKLHDEYGRGGTEVGIARAEGLSKREPVSPKCIVKIASYFARHEVDKDAPHFGDPKNPSAGYIAWLLWGGDEGRAWAERKKQQLTEQDAPKRE